MPFCFLILYLKFLSIFRRRRARRIRNGDLVFLLFMVFTMMDQHVGGENVCKELRCEGNGPAIRFPFRLLNHTRQPDYCSFPGFTLSCTDSNQTQLELPISVKLLVKNISYATQVIQLYDPNHCLPRDQLRGLDLSSSPFQFPNFQSFYSYSRGYGYALFNCSQTDHERNDHRRVSCLSGPTHQVYALNFGDRQSLMELPISSCTKMYNIPYVNEGALRGDANILHLNWSTPDCRGCELKGKNCRIWKTITGASITGCFVDPKGLTSTKLVILVAIIGSFLLGMAVFFAINYRVYRYDEVERENQAKIEMFLDDYRNLNPTRYAYSDIRRITNEFADKLGQGAYGTVFKGRLSNEIYVAVKILNMSKGNGNGEEFLNEVGTMGTIHHVNVVRLVGFCADGFRRALVYEFLSNNSLDKFISSADVKNQFLGWDKLQDIAIGIAKGIEYLHQGCDQRILHFDIKPHNILLDQNLNPKISDFGLAKLCSKDQSIVSMTTARGTMGYIAPEVFSRNFGNVTYKVDVYSFGMLLLEMVGGRKNIKVTTENISQVYFPEWIYNFLEQKEDLRVFIEDDGDAQIAKKLAIVGLWCIQWHPMNRPSMKVAVQMLEGGDNLTMPPNPFASTNTTRTNARIPAMNVSQELEVIPESE